MTPMRPMAGTVAMHNAPSHPHQPAAPYSQQFPPPSMQQAPQSMQQAPQSMQMGSPGYAQNNAQNSGPNDDLRVAGLGGGKNAWVIPVVVGIVALLLGGGIVIALVR